MSNIYAGLEIRFYSVKGSSPWQFQQSRIYILDDGSIQCRPKAKMLYIYLLEELITDANTEEESTISITEKEEFPTGLFFYY